MRIWHKNLITKLCRHHLLAMWMEGLGCYSIIIKNKKGYCKHPAVLEYTQCPELLWEILNDVRKEMLTRGYKPKNLPELVIKNGLKQEWQSLEKQIEILYNKKCGCKI